MGYTHYWRKLKFSNAGWKELRGLTETVMANLPTNVKIAWEYDSEDKAVEVSAKCIRFNGVGEEGHETFMLERKSSDFEFCKTNRKSYDLAVCSVLILASLLCESGQISSDGIGDTYTDSEWVDAWKFLSNLLPVPLSDREKVFKSFEDIPKLEPDSTI
jgi:hypothetical protein